MTPWVALVSLSAFLYVFGDTWDLKLFSVVLVPKGRRPDLFGASRLPRRRPCLAAETWTLLRTTRQRKREFATVWGDEGDSSTGKQAPQLLEPSPQEVDNNHACDFDGSDKSEQHARGPSCVFFCVPAKLLE